jgi:hypothetical protein
VCASKSQSEAAIRHGNSTSGLERIRRLPKQKSKSSPRRHLPLADLVRLGVLVRVDEVFPRRLLHELLALLLHEGRHEGSEVHARVPVHDHLVGGVEAQKRETRVRLLVSQSMLQSIDQSKQSIDRSLETIGRSVESSVNQQTIQSNLQSIESINRINRINQSNQSIEAINRSNRDSNLTSSSMSVLTTFAGSGASGSSYLGTVLRIVLVVLCINANQFDSS